FAFGEAFMVGDVVEIAPPVAGGRTTPERRQVVAGKDAPMGGAPPPAMNLLELGAAATPLPRNVLPPRRNHANAAGLTMVADASDVFADGGSVMNDAADLAALLCLGAASRLSLDDHPVTPPSAAKPVHRVSQVFRNWNLDRRRLNEWKTLVSGGATSER